MNLIKYYDVHTHKEVNDPEITRIVNLECCSVYNTKRGGVYSVGIHPWRISENFETIFDDFAKILKENSIVAVGEIGLDKCCKTPFVLQKILFKKQLQLAEQHSKPVIIHCVKAWDEIVGLKKYCGNQVWIIHSFGKSYEQAKKLLTRGCFLSFSPNILESREVPPALMHAPFDKIFLETDASSTNITELYSKVAEIRGISVEELASYIEANFKKVFGEEYIDVTK